MTKEDDVNFDKPSKCWICDNAFANVNIIVTLLENKEALHIDMEILTLTLFDNLKKLWFLSYYARTTQIQS